MKGIYVITSAQYGARPHLPFLKSLREYVSHRRAELMVIPMVGRSQEDDTLHPQIQELMVVDGKVRLNKNIQVERYHIRPQQIDPSTGMGRFSASDISTIFESSKQRMKVVPNSVANLPKVLMTTGAVTRPHYNLENRIGRIAEKDHVYGAIVVEVENNEIFHFRQLRGNTRGQFVDLGKKYSPDGSIDDIDVAAFIPGDWHTGDTDPEVRSATMSMLKRFMPRNLVLHDFFNGHSVSWFQERKKVSQARHHREGKMVLADELKMCAKELSDLVRAQKGRDITIVKSNHDERLDSYIEEARYLDHTENLYIGTKLAAEMVDGIDPLVAGIRMFYDIPSNVRFLTRQDELKAWGYLLSAHGDKGINGARGSTRSMENAYGKSVSGHPHTPEILRDTVKVGTSTHLDLDYNAGYASSWMNTHALIYEGGTSQLVNIIEGEWRLRSKR